MATGRIEIKTVLVSLVVVVVIEVVMRVTASGGGTDKVMLILGATRLLETIMIMLIVLILEGGLSFIGLSFSGVSFGFKRGLVWSAGFGIIVLIASAALFVFGIDPLTLIHTRLPAGQSEIVLFFLVGSIISPVAEEAFFRGVIYGFFRRWGVLTAVVLSTLAFVLSHPTGAGLPLSQITGGVLFAMAYEKERSLMVPITIHILGNMALFSLSLGTKGV